MKPKTLDHVAYWLADRDTVAGFAERHLGMHVIDRTDRFTLIGSNARHGKLTLFDAEGPRERGALQHSTELRVASSQHHELGVDGRHQVVTAGVEQLLDPVQRPPDVELVHPHTEHPDRLHLRADYHWRLLSSPLRPC